MPALTALLVPVLSAGPAAAATSTMPRTATAPASTEVPAPVSVSGGLPSDIVLKDVIPYNDKVKDLERRKTELTTEKQSLTKKAAKVNSRTDTYNAKDAACAARVKAHNSKMDAYEAKVDAWNSTSHDYVVPDQQAAYEAAVAEKEKLDAEGVALHQETASINAEQQQLDAEEAQLGVEQARLTTDMADHNAQVATWRSDQQQVERQHQQLLVEIATALQDQLDTPPTQATSMARGGDATGPLEPTAQAAQAPGGDATSRAGQVASISYYAVKNKVPVKFQPVVAQLSPSTISKQSASAAAQLAPTATYDGLLPEENGHYKAIEIQTSTANTSQERIAFNKALAHGGQATARLDGRPVVIDGTVTVPADGATPRAFTPSVLRALRASLSSPARGNNEIDDFECDTPQAERTIYQPLNKGRSTGVVALICPQDVKTPGSKRDDSASVYVQGYRSNLGLHRTHIFADTFHGEWRRENLFPGYSRMNLSGMKRCENAMKKSALKGPVLYSGQVDNSSGDIPNGINMTAFTPTGMLFNAYVANTKGWQVTC
ncbi:DNA/RNA non-specific endonuclease [Streptomyces sp. NPDC001315]|uniref:DNA/RNA non-specific endonuclease n=1 Tax=Streptomyces sp. NPDC001315 TaxID=3364562 RepID=UPI0036BF48C2